MVGPDDSRGRAPRPAGARNAAPRGSGKPPSTGSRSQDADRRLRREDGLPPRERATGVAGAGAAPSAAGRARPAAAGSGRPERGGAGRPGGPSGAPGRRAPSREEIAQRTYDPRREERRKATRVALPDDVDPRTLDGDARRELRSLSKDTADLVARHLVVTGQLLDEEPEQALAHARAARALAGRVAVVREAAGLAAYAAGEWAEALSELRAARRISGRPEHLAVMADCERALGRPERALGYGEDPQLGELDQDARVELVIVLSGARRDLGQADAAVLALQDPARRTTAKRPWAARLWYAYADALLAAQRDDQAREWFGRAAAVDVDGLTDAADRLLALEGIVLDDDEPDLQDRTDLPSDAELAELVKGIRGIEAPAVDTSAAPAPDAPDTPEVPLEPARPASGVAPPPFAAPVQDPQVDDGAGEGTDPSDQRDLRLFD